MKSSQPSLLRWIALFKLVKAVMMVAVGIAVLRLAHNHSEATLDNIVERFGIDPDRALIDRAIGKLANVSPEKLRAAGIASFFYAGLFFTEGFGLWLRKRWAEWFTTIITFSLVPLELYELHRHPTAGKVVVFLLNIAIGIYLIAHIRKERAEDHTA